MAATTSAAGKTTLSKDEIARLLAALDQNRIRFFSEPLRLRWRLHGGEPGSGSDAVALVADESGRLQAVYTRSRFDRSYQPPMLVEHFTGPLNFEQAAELVRTLLETPLFRETLPEESARGMADLMKETWEFQRGFTAAVSVSKTVFEPFPQNLSKPRAAFRALMAHLERSGERVVKSTKAPGKD